MHSLILRTYSGWFTFANKFPHEAICPYSWFVMMKLRQMLYWLRIKYWEVRRRKSPCTILSLCFSICLKFLRTTQKSQSEELVPVTGPKLVSPAYEAGVLILQRRTFYNFSPNVKYLQLIQHCKTTNFRLVKNYVYKLESHTGWQIWRQSCRIRLIWV